MPPEVEWAATGPVRRGWSMKTSIAILTALAMGLTGLGAGGTRSQWDPSNAPPGG